MRTYVFLAFVHFTVLIHYIETYIIHDSWQNNAGPKSLEIAGEEYIDHHYYPILARKTIENCPITPFRIKAKSESGKVLQLSSFPGSGNTWSRHLLERGSGILTGSIYNDATLKDVFRGETLKDGTRVIAVKTHHPAAFTMFDPSSKKWLAPDEAIYGTDEYNYDASIQVVRNPFGTLLATFNFLYSGENHTGEALPVFSNSSIFELFVQKNLQYWVKHISFYLHSSKYDDNGEIQWYDQRGKPVLLVFYESLKQDTIQELTRIFSFLKEYNLPYIDIDPQHAAVCSLKFDSGVGNFKRGSNPKVRRKTVYDHPLLNDGSGKTLREWICEEVQSSHRWTQYWRFNDPEWQCKSPISVEQKEGNVVISR